MVYGAASTGKKVMTSSSSPGISLKLEGISYLAGAELPAVIVNVVRGGPGLGTIQPSQADYFQSVKGGGHGDYRTPVLAPASVQELADLTVKAFALADEYRTPILLLGDGMMGQMKEPVVFPEPLTDLPEKPWALKGRGEGASRYQASLILDGLAMERHNWKLVRKYKEMAEKETLCELYMMDDADFAVVAYGTTARIAKGAIKRARKDGLKVGLVRPITLFPFPDKILQNVARQVKNFLVFEMSTGQMLEDVKLALGDKQVEISFHGRPGGIIPTPIEFSRVIHRYYRRMLK
jgi:2-oxoglutarate ferredoxin oxidoreductase subunit alpha